MSDDLLRDAAVAIAAVAGVFLGSRRNSPPSSETL